MDPLNSSSAAAPSPIPAADSRGDPPSCRIALVYPGDRQARRRAAPEESRFLPLFQALQALGARAEAAVYHDEFRADVRAQLAQVDAALVWVNPIEGGRDRSMLDGLLRDVAAMGVFVSAHPDVILALGTKEVLYRTRDLGWGCDTALYRTAAELREGLALRLAAGPRVLKQYRGNGGLGVWKLERADRPAAGRANALPGVQGDLTQSDFMVRARHAQRGSVEETISFDELCRRFEQYFAGDGRMIDQIYQPRLPDGMIRCYMVRDRVEGFGHQAVNALYPAPAGAPPQEAPQPGPRLYHPPTVPEFQRLKQQLEREWLPAAQARLGVEAAALPLLWDCDFLLGARDARGRDTYVLCEINMSSVSPFPESATVPLARAAVAAALAARDRRR